MGKEESDTAARGCYCGLWEKSPETLEGQGIPRGYCGICKVCGKPGHLRHFPGAVPYTDAWCDKHYRRLLFLHPRGSIGCFLWLAAAAAAIYLVATAIQRL